MATFKTFEEIQAWQKARVLNKRVGVLIDSGKFKNSYRLVHQIDGSAGSVMDNIAEGFERGGNREFFCNFCISQKVLVVNSVHGSIELLIVAFLHMLSFRNCI